MPAKYLLLLAASALLINRASCDTNHRLNSQITPIHYSIIITPYFNTGDALAFTFDGAVSISLETNATDVNKIRLHAQDLEISVSNVTLTSDTSAIGLNPANPLEFNANYSFVDINLEVPLQAGVRYTLAISYRGPIREDLNGFYRSSYVENGETKWLGATQMEPTHARKAFPCFDEPQYKATFSLSIDRPATYRQCLTNTKWQTSITLSNGYIRDVFTTTPKMSTYLVAFTVSELVPARQSIIGNREFAVYTRPDAVNQSDYAFDFGMRVEAALSNFFGIDYYSTDDNLKLDHVALTDFRAGAMENWGLIKYREALLLYVPEESTPYYKYRVAQIVAHETTHMWFGNLVTCHWWSNTWLNEGFANYFQDYITSLIEPDVRSANKLVTGSVYSAYAADEVPTAPAITNNDVNSPAEISAHFGIITYQKAGSVIRMIHHFIGDEAFRIGLNAYLQANQFSSGYPELLYGALTQGVQNTSSLANYPGVSLRQVMSEWIWQPGHPVLEVDVDYETGEVTLKQERFYSSSEFSSSEIYPIPITYTTQGEADFNNTKPAFVMNNESYVLNATGVLNHSWIIFNIQETGLYRVNYDRHTWQLLAQTLKGDERARIHHLNRAKIVNDLFAFLTADKVDFDLLHEVIGFLANENDNSVWLAAISGLNNLRTMFIGSDVLDDLDSYILTLMANITNELGYEVRATDDFETLENRMQVLNFACKLGHQGCIDNAVELFQAFRVNGTRISPSLRPVAYCNGLRHGNGEDYDFLWGELLSTNVGNEALVIQSALGCTRVQAKLQEYLESVTQEGSPIRSQDVTTPVSSILSDHANVEFVMNSLKSNYSVWSNTYPSMGTVLNYITAGLHTTTQFEEFESWLSNCVECSEDVIESAATSLASAKASAAWATEHRSDILHTLRNEAVGVAPSMGILLVASLVVGVRSM